MKLDGDTIALVTRLYIATIAQYYIHAYHPLYTIYIHTILYILYTYIPSFIYYIHTYHPLYTIYIHTILYILYTYIPSFKSSPCDMLDVWYYIHTYHPLSLAHATCWMCDTIYIHTIL